MIEKKEEYPQEFFFHSAGKGNFISRRAGRLLLKAYEQNRLNRLTLNDAMMILDLGVTLANATLNELVAKDMLVKSKGSQIKGVYYGYLAPEEAERLREELNKKIPDTE